MIKKVKKYIVNNNLIQDNDRVLVALSGGPDSVCLLHILYCLKKEIPMEIGAVHINHMLRGKEAEEDTSYVENLCKSLGIECYVKKVDIKSMAAERNISLEMAGRDARYRTFETIRREYGYNKIAVAHNANDQAETIIMRMMRGTGLDGLTGIKAKREGNIIRPILCLNRQEIEAYCTDYELIPRIDKSNYERIYSRNKVRLDILPYMKQNFNEDIVETLNRMATLLQKDNEYIEEQVKLNYSKYCNKKNGRITIDKELFVNEKEAIVSRILKNAFKNISNSHQNFEMKHIYEIIELFNKGTGKRIDLTNNIIAENLYGDIVLRKNKQESINKEEVLINKNELDKNIEYSNCMVKFGIIKMKNEEVFSNNTLIKYFDYDKIKETVVIRNRKDGDRIKPLGVKGTKKLKDLFIDLKIPREERDTIPLVCFDNEIAWIVGYKVSDSFKITKDTKNILKIEFVRKG